MLTILAICIFGVAANPWYDSTPVIFWGKTASNPQSVEVLVSIKGCLKKATQVSLAGAASCPLPPGKEVLIGGTQAGTSINVKCGDIIVNPPPQDRVFFAAQTDPNCKTKCSDDSTPLTCKPAAQVCGPANKYPCGATKCDSNGCAGCSPVFWNSTNNRVCDDICPDRSSPLMCKENPCDYSSKDSLKCPNAAAAAFCFPSRCGGCVAQWYDVYGRPVCGSTCILSGDVNFGKGPAKLGFSVVGGACKAVSGKKAPVALYNDMSSCTESCVCIDNGFADFGKCGASLGWTIVKGVCTQVSGCPEMKTTLNKHTFFDTLAACSTTCPNLKVPTKVAPAAASSGSTRCAGQVVECKQDPCMVNPPQCVEAQGALTCLADNCGACTAKWLKDGQPFQCPTTQPCSAGSPNCCAGTNTMPRTCSGTCDKNLCAGAASCAPDPCNGCLPSFKDASGKNIPTSSCRGNMNPSAFVKCQPGDADCCKSGFRPIPCGYNLDAALNQTCTQLTCGTNKQRTCTVDGCNGCALEVKNEKKENITNQCEVAVPDMCSSSKCPNMGSPSCPAKPTQCDGFNIKCVKDACACKWRWFAADLRQPRPECVAALSKCYSPDECPNNYQCDPLPDSQLLGQHPEFRNELVCSQEPCTCRPVWVPPSYGLRASCKPGEPGCCADNLTIAQCPLDQAQWTCSKLSCTGQTAPVQCRADGCNQCQLDIFDSKQVKLPKGSCRLALDKEMKQFCAKVKCPAASQKAACPPRPTCYPDDWALDCIVDPCSCRSMWVDQDVRTTIQPQCSKQIYAPCLPQEQCPTDFECSDLSPDALARMDPATQKALVCIQEPCTCRPVSTHPSMLPAGFRLPCKNSTCCADGKGPAVCPAQLAIVACAAIQCGTSQIGSCIADGCNSCNIKVTGKDGKIIPLSSCRIPLNESAICPGTVCPPMNGPPQCSPRPSQCAADWKLRCIRDPCVCTRNIWVDEDLRIADPACTAALQPQCATSCPTQFSCPGLVPPLRCIQEPCTCRPVVDPASIPPPQRMPMPGQAGQAGQAGPGPQQPGQQMPAQQRPAPGQQVPAGQQMPAGGQTRMPPGPGR